MHSVSASRSKDVHNTQGSLNKVEIEVNGVKTDHNGEKLVFSDNIVEVPSRATKVHPLD